MVVLLVLVGTPVSLSIAGPPKSGLFQVGYRPDNVFAYPGKLSLDFRRVAVLPVAAEGSGSDLQDGCATLNTVLWDELLKTKRFELVAVDSTALRQAAGKAGWTGLEGVPLDFLAFLRREYGCDGVLFAELTEYHAYAPLAVGWRLKLVDARSGQILWAVDEQFDAARPEVYRAAQRFGNPKFRWPFLGHEDNWLAANSPRCFGTYATAAVLATLPDR